MLRDRTAVGAGVVGGTVAVGLHAVGLAVLVAAGHGPPVALPGSLADAAVLGVAAAVVPGLAGGAAAHRAGSGRTEAAPAVVAWTTVTATVVAGNVAVGSDPALWRLLAPVVPLRLPGVALLGRFVRPPAAGVGALAAGYLLVVAATAAVGYGLAGTVATRD